MIFTRLFTVLVTALLFVGTACSSDPCDEGYTAVEDNGTTACLPDYVVGLEAKLTSKTRFFHVEHGVITYHNGEWTNHLGERITDLLKIQ